MSSSRGVRAEYRTGSISFEWSVIYRSERWNRWPAVAGAWTPSLSWPEVPLLIWINAGRVRAPTLKQGNPAIPSGRYCGGGMAMCEYGDRWDVC